MNRTVPKKKSYETPYTKKTQVELEESYVLRALLTQQQNRQEWVLRRKK